MTQRVSLRDAAIAVAALLVPLIFVGWLHWMVLDEWRTSRSLASTGVATVAGVLDAEADIGPRSEGYRVTYRYDVIGSNGATATRVATTSVDRATFDSIDIGQTVDIRYDPDDPSRSDIARNDRLTTMVAIMVLVDLALVGVVVAIVRSSRAGLVRT